MPRQLINLNEKFELFNGNGYSNAINSVELPRHRWYFIKEAFSPVLVEKAIEYTNLSKGKSVIDPFCGSGTVPLVASNHGYMSCGLEVNPFLAFVATSKLLDCDLDEFTDQAVKVRSFCEQGAPSCLEGFSTFSPTANLQKWLFNLSVLRAFTGGWNATMAINGPNQKLLQLALLGAVMDCCNAVRDGKALRYRKEWRELSFSLENFLLAFDSRLEVLKADTQNRINIGDNQSKVVQGDARKVLGKLKEKFGLCVTSPPYLNSFDYTDVYRPELFLGRFITSQIELRKLRLETVRSHVQAKWDDPVHKNFGPRYQEVMKLIRGGSAQLWNQRIILMIQAYFEDMKCVLATLKKLADTNAILWLVVSTSAYVGVEIPVDLILADIGQQVGWEPIDVGLIRYLRSSSQHYETLGVEQATHRLRESVVILRAK